MRAALLGSLLALVALPAAADSRPPVLPTRDVTVDYHVESSQPLPVQDVRIEAQAGAERLRVEQPNNLTLLIDRANRRATMMLPAQHAALRLPWPKQVAQGFDILARAHFERRGEDTQAGLACTVYDVTEQANRLTACLTDDGLVLRADGEVSGKRGAVEYHITATTVSYGPLAAELFTLPPGFTELKLPNFGG